MTINCNVGAGSVVVQDIPDYSIVAGNPAKVIKILKVEDNRII
jgi:acetyltransferase-like isoleucine patch superfamily enzyme